MDKLTPDHFYDAATSQCTRQAELPWIFASECASQSFSVCRVGKEDMSYQGISGETLTGINAQEPIFVIKLKLEKYLSNPQQVLEMFQFAAYFGRLDVCEYLFARGVIGPSEARAEESRGWQPPHKNYVLHTAAKNGHVQILKFLKDTLGLTQKDARSCDNKALRMACRYGHCRVLRFLKDEWHLTNTDACACVNIIICSAAQNGHVDVLQFLEQEWGLITKHNRIYYDGLILAAINGHLEVCKFFKNCHQPFDSSKAERVLKYLNLALHDAIKNREEDVYKFLKAWIVELNPKFCPTPFRSSEHLLVASSWI